MLEFKKYVQAKLSMPFKPRWVESDPSKATIKAHLLALEQYERDLDEYNAQSTNKTADDFYADAISELNITDSRRFKLYCHRIYKKDSFDTVDNLTKFYEAMSQYQPIEPFYVFACRFQKQKYTYYITKCSDATVVPLRFSHGGFKEEDLKDAIQPESGSFEDHNAFSYPANLNVAYYSAMPGIALEKKYKIRFINRTTYDAYGGHMLASEMSVAVRTIEEVESVRAKVCKILNELIFRDVKKEVLADLYNDIRELNIITEYSRRHDITFDNAPLETISRKIKEKQQKIDSTEYNVHTEETEIYENKTKYEVTLTLKRKD